MFGPVAFTSKSDAACVRHWLTMHRRPVVFETGTRPYFLNAVAQMDDERIRLGEFYLEKRYTRDIYVHDKHVMGIHYRVADDVWDTSEVKLTLHLLPELNYNYDQCMIEKNQYHHLHKMFLMS